MELISNFLFRLCIDHQILQTSPYHSELPQRKLAYDMNRYSSQSTSFGTTAVASEKLFAHRVEIKPSDLNSRVVLGCAKGSAENHVPFPSSVF